MNITFNYLAVALLVVIAFAATFCVKSQNKILYWMGWGTGVLLAAYLVFVLIGLGMVLWQH